MAFIITGWGLSLLKIKLYNLKQTVRKNGNQYFHNPISRLQVSLSKLPAKTT